MFTASPGHFVRISIAAILVAVLVVSLSPAQHAEAHRGSYVVQAGNGLNLRTGPGGNYHRLYTMADGTLVKARGHRGSWMFLTDLSTGTTGWAWLAYLVQAGSSGGDGSTSGLQLCWDTSFNWTACAPEWIAQAIYEASQYYGVPFWAMMGIASCESAFRPDIVNQSSGVIGLYQFEPSTFYWQSPGANIWSVYDQAYTAAKMLARGLSSHFDCAWRIGY